MLRIVISSPKGGCGKTNTARNLAAAAAHDGFTVSTADLDPQRSLTRWARRRPGDVPGIVHYQVEWTDAEALTAEDGIESSDVLFIDTPPSIEAHPVEMRRLITVADLILVPCRASFDDVESAVPYLKALRASGAKPIVVINFSRPRLNVAAEKGMLLAAAELCPIEMGERADYNRAGSKGYGLIDITGHVGSDEVRTLWAYVKQRLGIDSPSTQEEAEPQPKPKARSRKREAAHGAA
ncbi:ParA family protein [Belnapia sp. T18]|uniref:ParA family protein n=1 Tax=Belnapia arida TaxID=2804533 RepID=A0ABS1UAK2_9PROT|nr:ParA family protein [Belnapia arida]MBL6081689.1 ParA family protein [Belnapia arida]